MVAADAVGGLGEKRESETGFASDPEKWTLANFLGLLLASFLLHFTALDDWWMFDDPQVLLHATRYGPVKILFDPPSWRYLSTSSFTPLVTISFWLDFELAGLRPAIFHAHQLVALGLAAGTLFLLLKRHGSKLDAWLTALLFLLMPASIDAAHTLMVRHYVEGLALAAASYLFWRKAHRRSDLLSALLYFLAILSKEFFIPVPLLFLLESWFRDGSAGRSLLRIIPHSLAATGYLLWRSAMLGSQGGYGVGFDAASIERLPATLFRTIFDLAPTGALASRGVSGLLVASIFGVVLAWGLVRDRSRAAAFAVAMMTVIAIPLPVLSRNFEPRYAFPATAGLIVLVGLVRIPPRWSVAVRAGLVIFGFFNYVAHQRAIEKEGLAMRAEGRYIWSAPASASSLLAGSPGWYLAGLSELRLGERGDRSPRFVLSRHGLVAGELPLVDVVTAQAGSPELRTLDRDTVRALLLERARFDANSPLAISIGKRGHDLHWKVDAPGDATLTFLTYPGYDEYPFPREGSRKIPEARERQFFRIRADLPEGRWTMSPPLELPSSERSVSWRRGAKEPAYPPAGKGNQKANDKMRASSR